MVTYSEFLIKGFKAVRVAGATVTSAVPVIFILLQIRLSDSSVKFNRFRPSFVSLYTFRGLSVSMFQTLLTWPFFSSVPKSGYMVLGPK